MDWIPVVSQVKSAVQAISGDLDGARKTQERFSMQCPVVSQVRSTVEAVSGDTEAAQRTQMEQLNMLNGVANAVPVVGHVKGAVHYACGDHEGGDAAMKASSRTTAVVGGGIGGFCIGGPVGAVAGGVAGGAAADGATTGIESGIKGKYCPNGTVASVTDACNANGANKSGHIFDAVVGPVADGFTGYVAGNAACGGRGAGGRAGQGPKSTGGSSGGGGGGGGRFS